MKNNLIVSYAPHIHGNQNIRNIMLDVIIALIPALIGGIYFFGLNALVTVVTSVAFCVLAEYVWDKATKKENTTKDLSAIVTGILLAYCLPAGTPLYMVAVGDIFAIIVVKCFYGGIGQNFVNPALAARAFLLACWPVALTTYHAPSDPLGLFCNGIDVTSGATPLNIIKHGGEAISNANLFWGNVSGCIGEVSAFLILLGAAYLLIKRVVDLVIPLTYIISVGIFGVLFTDCGFIYHILSGGVMLAAFFMATDYATSPVSKGGQFVFALGAGLITAVIRAFGGYPEGVTYAILIMNIITPLLDKHMRPRLFGSKAVKNNG